MPTSPSAPSARPSFGHVLLGIVVCASLGVACSSSGSAAHTGGGTDAGAGPGSLGVKLTASPQTAGDPEAGRQILLNGSYMSCGVPVKLWNDATIGPVVKGALGNYGELNVPGREGPNAQLPLSLNQFTTTDGAEVIQRTCLSCHSGHFDGQLVIGMGNADADFTGGFVGNAPTSPLPDTLLNQLGLTDAEKANLAKVQRIGRAFGPETVMRTVGMNPAEAFTGVLLSHHDQKTLAWSETPLVPVAILDGKGGTIPDAKLTSDPPPWWRAKKKNAMFYNGMARGEHRGTMELATAVCVDTLEEAQRVDGLFRDIQAFIGTVKAPIYGRHIDAAMAARGKDVFTTTCSGCHGTYAKDPLDDASDTYPNLLIPLDVIGTDPAIANMGVVHAPTFVDWYNGMFYGEITPAAPNDPFPGYMPPPLDGVWATAPYLHNGSVPTVDLMLNSKARPKYWKRVDHDTSNFDEDALGWPWVEVSYSQADAPDTEKTQIYDTTYWSQTNGGHTFGDALSSSERRDVIEYLKTL